MDTVRVRNTSSGTGQETASVSHEAWQSPNNGMWYPPDIVQTANELLVYSYEKSSLQSEMEDTVVENFYKRRATGEIFQNPMTQNSIHILQGSDSGLEVEYRADTCSYDKRDWSKHISPWVIHRWEGDTSFEFLSQGLSEKYHPTDDISTDRAQDLAVSEAWSNIQYSDILGLAALAEARSTVLGLIEVFVKVRKIFRSVKKLEKQLNFAKTKKELRSIQKNLEDLYLNARYGLRPLYYDIMGILRVLENKPIDDRLTFRGSQSDSYDKSDVKVYKCTRFPSGSGYGVYMKADRKLSVTLSARAGVLVSQRDHSLGKRLGIDAISETLWDLTPFSFIIDWFFNVGDVILSWTPKPGAEVLTSWVTVYEQQIQKTVLSVDHCNSQPQPDWAFATGWNWYKICSIPPVSDEKITVKKYRLPDPPRSIFPHLSVNLDCLKLLDLALIIKSLRA